MNWMVAFDQAAEPCCPWPAQCSCRPSARQTVRVKVPHQARQPLARSLAHTAAPAYAARPTAPAFDLNVSGDAWEVVLADLVSAR